MIVRIGLILDIIIFVIKVLDRVRIVLIERLMLFVKIIKVMLNVINLLMVIWWSRFKIFSGLRKLGFKIDIMIMRINKLRNGLSFCMILLKWICFCFVCSCFVFILLFFCGKCYNLFLCCFLCIDFFVDFVFMDNDNVIVYFENFR